MATHVRVIFVDGVFKPQTPVRVREHAELTLAIPPEAELPPEGAPGVADDWRVIDGLVGCAQSGVGDVAEKHDDYLYGDPHA